jgi:hypothetical protein
MPAELTEVTEIGTALGMLAPSLDAAFARPPDRLRNVPSATWERLAELWAAQRHAASFATAFENGRAFLHSTDGLRGRPPLRVEWKGPHRPPGDDVVPADLRIDHVYLVSCKYLSKVLVNPGPQRLFERLLVGDERGGAHWFAHVAEPEFQAMYDAAVGWSGLAGLPVRAVALDRTQQRALREALRARELPPELEGPWGALCAAVAERTARRWSDALGTPRARLRLLWRLLRITNCAYYVLGTDGARRLRFRLDSTWDWMQSFELRHLEVTARASGQPEVGWRADVRRRGGSEVIPIAGHVEIRWSHGRFNGAPEAKVYLDTPHGEVPGYNSLR